MDWITSAGLVVNTKTHLCNCYPHLEMADASVLYHGNILFRVLDYLDAFEIARASLVNKKWNEVSKSSFLWDATRGNFTL